MLKRISCRVVRSVALSKSGDVVAANVRVRQESDSIRDRGLFCEVLQNGNPAGAHNLSLGGLSYTSRLGIARVSTENSLTGQNLDCYA
jgi:hypothetical protein